MYLPIVQSCFDTGSVEEACTHVQQPLVALCYVDVSIASRTVVLIFSRLRG